MPKASAFYPETTPTKSLEEISKKCLKTKIKVSSCCVAANLSGNAKSCHSERRALKHASYLQGGKKKGKKMSFTLVVLRFSRTGLLGSSRPCANCIQALQKSSKYIRIKEVIYSTEDGGLKREKFSELTKDLSFVSSGFRY
jgi:pyrimidine deaminase RibD-like protein